MKKFTPFDKGIKLVSRPNDLGKFYIYIFFFIKICILCASLLVHRLPRINKTPGFIVEGWMTPCRYVKSAKPNVDMK